MSAKNTIITLHGRDYRISTVNDPEYTRRLVEYCNGMMQTIESASGVTDYLKLMVLSILQVTHTYFEEMEKNGGKPEEMDAKLNSILETIEKTEKELAKLTDSAK